MPFENFPITGESPNESNALRGGGRLYWAAWVIGGSDAVVTYMGQLAEGGLDIADEFEYVLVDGEESLAPSDASVSTHNHKWTGSLIESPIETVNKILHGTNTNLVDTGPKSIAIGGFYNGKDDPRTTQYQFVFESPAGWSGGNERKMGYHQIYKGLFKKTGAQKMSRKGIATLGFEIQAFHDWTITTTAGGPGKLGRKWVQDLA